MPCVIIGARETGAARGARTTINARREAEGGAGRRARGRAACLRGRVSPSPPPRGGRADSGK
eukprot:scaffold82555_cov49-Phaeocystis_antarctica.AAC.5